MKHLKEQAPLLSETAIKTSGGFAGSFLAMSINDWAGLIVAILTGFYLILQILEIMHKRRTRRNEKQD